MDIKKISMFLFFIIILQSFIIAQEYKLEISTIPEDKIFGPSETIQLKVALYNLDNTLVQDKILVTFEDIHRTKIKEVEVQSNTFEKVELTGEGISGEGRIIAKYKNSEKTVPFFIKEKELIKFELKGEELIVTNIGNSVYNEKIYITIGQTTGTKTPNIKVGDSIVYRLIAPKGVYNIKVTSGETTLIKNGVQLTGTGKVTGALDESIQQGSHLTGSIRPDSEDSEGDLLGYMKNSKAIYVFIMIIIGAMVLLTIERRYRKKAGY
jgi:hypothetical protein